MTLKMMLGLGVAILVGVWFGRQYAGSELISLRSLTKEQAVLLRESQEELASVRASEQVAIARLETLQSEMSEKLPEDGPLRDLIAQLKARLSEDVSPERLSYLIKSGRPPSNCTDPETKRFILSTPELDKMDSKVSVDNESIVVSGFGASAKDEEGAAEAWFDPAKPVIVNFISKSGQKKVKKETLPFATTIVEGDREYRFSVEEGARSFVKVIYDSCDYP